MHPGTTPARSAGFGEIFRLVATGAAHTRADLAELTGLARPTVQARVERLVLAGLLVDGATVSSGGRPARRLQVDPLAAVAIAVEIGEDHTRVALHDLAGLVLESRTIEISPRVGPVQLLEQAAVVLEEILAAHQISAKRAIGIGIALPAPVDDARRSTIGWSVISGWQGFDVATFFEDRLGVPAIVDNDANLLAIAEHRKFWSDTQDLYYVKVGNGIGSGIIVNGLLYRGAQGASGDLGHSHLTDAEQRLCRCGNIGCLEALAGGWAIGLQLSERSGNPALTHVRDVVALVEAGDATATLAVREAGRHVGEMVALATSLLNPAMIVLGGALSAVGGHLVASVRQSIYQRAHPLATRELRIEQARGDELTCVTGAALTVIDSALSPITLDESIMTPSWRHGWRRGWRHGAPRPTPQA